MLLLAGTQASGARSHESLRAPPLPCLSLLQTVPSPRRPHQLPLPDFKRHIANDPLLLPSFPSAFRFLLLLLHGLRKLAPDENPIFNAPVTLVTPRRPQLGQPPAPPNSSSSLAFTCQNPNSASVRLDSARLPPSPVRSPDRTRRPSPDPDPPLRNPTFARAPGAACSGTRGLGLRGGPR